jgi:hypothetical protein
MRVRLRLISFTVDAIYFLYRFSLAFVFLCFELWTIGHLGNAKGTGVKINNSLEINGRK